MRTANLISASTRLDNAIKTLDRCWDTLRDSWRDRKANEFETEFLAPLKRQVQGTVQAMAELGELLERMYRDCE
ncbi:hypothetical protein Isop_1513 [Isosphaera pallida ATCC 43644]|jgi:hypothetical protein|uniref:WXG100 family type VII secretion target n=1 Tax=Isosphaera pallida (strain ATCC 43644 / DSM 9630 / IS1B) TaxID=575540 RepID=E8QYW1_ISOPI|nr:hypothetical protein [Isosphaera pallida]ADV62098.1 hypothetical protein Isop_1513 [Isosphaera pallida ATCC 43644]